MQRTAECGAQRQKCNQRRAQPEPYRPLVRDITAESEADERREQREILEIREDANLARQQPDQNQLEKQAASGYEEELLERRVMSHVATGRDGFRRLSKADSTELTVPISVERIVAPSGPSQNPSVLSAQAVEA